MADRNKAIRILEGSYKNFVLRHNGELLTVNELIALLKAQEPRVMSLEEAQAALHTERVVWTECEEKNGDKLLYVGLHMNGTDYFTMQDDSVMEETDLDDGMGAELYGKKYRLWTSQPTDEQREATPWQV